MSYSNDGIITVLSEEVLPAYTVIGLTGGRDNLWEVALDFEFDGTSAIDDIDVYPLAVTTQMSNSKTAQGDWITSAVVLGKQSISQFLLAPFQTITPRTPLFCGPGGQLVGPDSLDFLVYPQSSYMLGVGLSFASYETQETPEVIPVINTGPDSRFVGVALSFFQGENES